MASSIKYYRRARQEWIEHLGGCCVVCGATEKLEIDHIDRSTKSFDPSTTRKSKATNLEELKKCQLLCRKHHLEKTARESRKEIRHGTYIGYQHYKCRCEECRTAQNAWRRDLRLRKDESKTTRGPYRKNTEHGTGGFYRKGCRCDICRAWNRDKKRMERQQQLQSSPRSTADNASSF